MADNHDLLIQQLRRHEGVRLKPYRCPAGKLTIGVGRNLEDVGISPMESDILLGNDVERVMRETQGLVSVAAMNAMGGTRRCVLYNMVFNMGRGAVTQFRKMLSALEALDYKEAAAQMLDSRWAKQVGDRAMELAEQMKDGQWKK